MHRARFAAALVVANLALTALAANASAQALDLRKYSLVDLTHPFNSSTIYWPTAPSSFTFSHLSRGQTPGGWYYASGAFAAPEHGGTHIDAPVHFSEPGHTVEQIPLESLMGPALVVDVSEAASGNADYELSVSDLIRAQALGGPLSRGTIVLVRTGWASRWGDRQAYLGDDTPGDASSLHFPGIGAEAARHMVEKGVAAVGIDTASLDPGKSTDFQAHRILAKANIPGFENLNLTDTLPRKGISVIALPMKIEGGTGGPLRAVAVVPKR